MTLNDIIIRDLAICRREQSLEDYNREISRRLWRRRLKTIGDCICGAATLILFFALAMAFVACPEFRW